MPRDSVWAAPQNFMFALSADVRTLRATWSPESGARLGVELSSVTLQAGALNGSAGYLTLSYWFRNLPRCRVSTRAPLSLMRF